MKVYYSPDDPKCLIGILTNPGKPLNNSREIVQRIREFFPYGLNTGFLQNETLINNGGIILEEIMKRPLLSNQGINESIRKIYEAFLRNVNLVKTDKRVADYVGDDPSKEYYPALHMYKEGPGCTFEDALAENFNALIVKKMVEYSSDPKLVSDESAITRKCTYIMLKPQLLPDYYNIGYEPLFGEDPIVNIAARLGIGYEECATHITSFASITANFLLGDAAKSNGDDNVTACLALRACCDYLPENEVDKIKRVLNRKGKKINPAKQMILDFDPKAKK